MQVPAYCPRCSLTFASGIELGPGATAHISSSVTTCPNCRAGAPILDGVFRGTQDFIEVLAGPRITRDLVERLEAFLVQAREKTMSPAAIADSIREEFPEASHPGLAAALVKTLVTDPKFLIATIIAVLALWYQMQSPSKQDIQDAFEAALAKQYAAAAQTASGRPRPATDGTVEPQKKNAPNREKGVPHRRSGPKIGRNDPCHCGSGIKLKKCHGS